MPNGTRVPPDDVRGSTARIAREERLKIRALDGEGRQLDEWLLSRSGKGARPAWGMRARPRAVRYEVLPEAGN